jgi:SAM-dependent methyltransferase
MTWQMADVPHWCSVLELPFPAGAFDRVMCQLGLQFFPARETALREFSRVLVAGGRIALNAFGPIAHTLDDEASARTMAERVKAAIPSATIRVVQVLTEVWNSPPWRRNPGGHILTCRDELLCPATKRIVICGSVSPLHHVEQVP